jgi:hypothetical protein
MGPVKRLNDWEVRLEDAIQATPPFAWGAADCCTFAARIVKAITGKDFAEQFRYRDAFGAKRILSRYGGVEGIATRFLGVPKESGLASRGDVVLVQSPKSMLAICAGHVIAAQGDGGVLFLPLSAALKAWSV